MPPKSLTISAIIPLYNGRRFISQALTSIANQTLPAHEVIVVDDGSTDDGLATVEQFARTYPVKILRKPNGGQSSARNFGIAGSSGDLIALLDQDDIWYPSHLEELVRQFANGRSTTIGWAYSNLDEIDEDGRLVARKVLDRSGARHPKTHLLDCLQHDMFILPSASLLSRSAFDSVGGFDERLSGYEDDDLFIRLFRQGYQHVYIGKALSQWRIYAGSTSFSPAMARSRMVYARKLIDGHPDDPLRNLSYVRDAIAPRFRRTLVDAMRQALRVGNYAAATICRADITALESALTEAERRQLLRSDLVTTVVLPLHNGAQHIEEALTSVFQQTIPPDEIIVVDSGSTDDGPTRVAALARQQPIRLLSAPNAGRSAARNHGVRQAHGDLIAMLDQDDIWYPSHLETLVAPFKDRRSRPLGWAYGNVDEISAQDGTLTPSILQLDRQHSTMALADSLAQDVLVLPSASVVSRLAFDAVGGFDEHLSGFEDDDLFIRMLQAGYDNAFIDAPLARWRVHRESDAVPSRLARSRMAFARKLIATCPEWPTHYVKDLIVPRFMAHALIEARKALASANEPWIDDAFKDLHFLERFLKPDGARPVRRDPLITAIIPLFNGEAFIEEAIHSILAQTLKPDEIIVVDDGSTDAGPGIVSRLAESHPIRLIRQENSGQSSARNIGVEHAHGDLIAFLDQDDVWYPDHLTELVKPFLEQRPTELGWSYSNLDEIDKAGEVICRCTLNQMAPLHPKRDLFNCLSHDMFVLPSASLVSRRVFLTIGGFDERLSGYEDDDLFLRMFRAGFDNVYIPRSLSKWRIYQSSSSYSPRMAISRATYARKLVDRFPDDADASRFYVRDLIAPRFFRSMATELRKAVLKGTPDQRVVALANLRFISGHLRLRRRLPIQLLLLPALRIPPLARWIMRYRIPLATLFRIVF